MAALRKPDYRLLIEACKIAEGACQSDVSDVERLTRKLGVACKAELAAMVKDANAKARAFDRMRQKIAEMIGEDA